MFKMFIFLFIGLLGCVPHVFSTLYLVEAHGETSLFFSVVLILMNMGGLLYGGVLLSREVRR